MVTSTDRRTRSRPGSASVEMAFLLMPMLIMLVCTWEVARIIEAHQVLINAAREGIRLAVSGRSFTASGTALQQKDFFSAAAGGKYISDGMGGYREANTTATPPEVGTHNLTNPDAVKNQVKNYIARAGFDTTTMANSAITFTNLSQPSNPYAWQSNPSSGPAASQFDHMRVTVNFPADRVRWIFLPNFINLGTTLTATAEWSSVQDIPVTVDLEVGVN